MYRASIASRGKIRSSAGNDEDKTFRLQRCQQLGSMHVNMALLDWQFNERYNSNRHPGPASAAIIL